MNAGPFLKDLRCGLQARRSVAVYAAARPLWQPGGTPPAHLDGSLPGEAPLEPASRPGSFGGSLEHARGVLEHAMLTPPPMLTLRCSAHAGDFGFDPLNLGSDPTALDWCARARCAPRVI